jgi:hypothetical protein
MPPSESLPKDGITFHGVARDTFFNTLLDEDEEA